MQTQREECFLETIKAWVMKNKSGGIEKRVPAGKNSLCRLRGKKLQMPDEVMTLIQSGWNKPIFYKGEGKAYSRNWEVVQYNLWPQNLRNVTAVTLGTPVWWLFAFLWIMNHLAILLLAVDLLARKVSLNTIFRGFIISEGSESPAQHIKTLVQIWFKFIQPHFSEKETVKSTMTYKS